MPPSMDLNESRVPVLGGVPGGVPGAALAAERADWDYDGLNGSLARNASLLEFPAEDYVFDRADVRALFIVLYTLVFCCCFFGNLLVIIVVTLSRRLRSITNFFLANLAVADLCVGMFCVYQNLSTYLVQSWVLGDLVCKLYHFVHSLSYTASIFILVVICTERYFAIIHPITCKQILTPRRLRIVMLCVWVLSALYSSPRFFWVQTISMRLGRSGSTETICISHRQKYNSETFDIINFGLLYAAPLAVMLLLYTRIALVLWDAGRGPPGIHHHPSHQRSRNGRSYHVSASQNILKARRGVVRMLIVVVLTFAICNLPYHARKMWQYWSASYEGDSSFSSLFTPATFLLTYFNSGINPLLYAFLSRNFRKGMRELLLCPSREKGRPLAPQSSITRKTSVRSATKLYTAAAAHHAAHNLALANEHSG
ncbi:trissin receptor-like [Thrips palmi]|uniref:Trissin receptor-like n=1 Tax=Thrips palmi TaxID=161013 RepID=A0A6P8YD09_THRPL|nr:trissin receptor-like [Thrips palmi]